MTVLAEKRGGTPLPLFNSIGKIVTKLFEECSSAHYLRLFRIHNSASYDRPALGLFRYLGGISSISVWGKSNERSRLVSVLFRRCELQLYYT